MLNRWTGIGRLGKPPNVRSTTNGKAMASFSIAAETSWWDSSKRERKKRTDWVPCIVWGGLTKVVESHLRKGTLVYVEGRFTSSSWDDKKTGERRYKTEITVEELRVLAKGANGSSGKPAEFETGDDFDKRSADEFDAASATGDKPVKEKEPEAECFGSTSDFESKDVNF